MNKLRIWWLKRRLRNQIISLNRDYAGYDGGNHVMGIITGGLYTRRKLKIEKLKDPLREIVPDFPRSA